VKRTTRKPLTFLDWREKSYWHSAQDVAYRAGCAIELRAYDVFLVFDDGEERICDVADTERPWFTIWTAVKTRFPALYRTPRVMRL
jgi:hypothetical protein